MVFNVAELFFFFGHQAIQTSALQNMGVDIELLDIVFQSFLTYFTSDHLFLCVASLH